MTVENETSKTDKLVMGSKNYDFSFNVLLEDPTEEDAKEAIRCMVSNGNSEIELVYGTDYSVQLNKEKKGGVVTVVDPKDDTWTIIIYRQYKSVQGSDYNDYNSFPAETLEADLDKHAMILQQLEETLKRCAKVPITSADNPETLLFDSIAKCAELEQKAASSTEMATTQAEIATKQAVIATEVAALANKTVDGFDAHAAEKQNEIDASANAAAQSAAAALISETNASASATAAALSQAAADTSQTKASNSAAEAKESETHAKLSETAAKESETKAKASEMQALSSETKAKESEGKALTFANSAAQSASEAERFRNEAEAIVDIPDASEALKGVAKIATVAEVAAGTDKTKIVTPATAAGQYQSKTAAATESERIINLMNKNYVPLSGNATINGAKTFLDPIYRKAAAGSSGPALVNFTDSNGKGSTSLNTYYSYGGYYARLLCENKTAAKNLYLDLTINDSGVPSVAIGGTAGYLPSATDNSNRVATTACSQSLLAAKSAPKPQTTTGVGQIIAVNAVMSAGKYTLPSGGTWFYNLYTSLSNGGGLFYSNTPAGIAAGGTVLQLVTGGLVDKCYGFLWRIQ